MTRKITTILLALALCLTLLPVGAGAVDTTTYTLKNDDSNTLLCGSDTVSASNSNGIHYGDGNNTTTVNGYVLDGGTTGATYKLDADATIDKPLIIRGGTAANPVTLDLCGNVLQYNNSSEKNSVIVVESGAYFTLTDSEETSKSYTYTVNSDSTWTLVTTGTSGANTIQLTGGVITGGKGTQNSSKTTTYGGGVLVDGGATFKMTGGNIVGCTAVANGGGVYLACNASDSTGATFEMTGGSIVGCTTTGNSKNGGGVYVNNSGTFKMTGGSIEYCTTKNNGGVYNQGTFTMGGGNIVGCIAVDNGGGGGGVYNIGENATFTMSAGSISGCTAKNGGGVCVDKGTFTMEGGTIKDCTATSNNGGGVSVGNFTATMNANGGSVYGNVYVNKSGTLTNTSGGDGTTFVDGITNNGGNTKKPANLSPKDGKKFLGWFVEKTITGRNTKYYQEFKFGSTETSANSVPRAFWEGDFEVEVNNSYYTTFNDAWSGVTSDGHTFKFLKNVNVGTGSGNTFSLNNNATFDLNGNTVSGNIEINYSSDDPNASVMRSLTVKDSSTDEEGKLDGTVTVKGNLGQLNVWGGTVNNVEVSDSGKVYCSGGTITTLNVTGGTVNHTGGKITTLNLTGGTVNCGDADDDTGDGTIETANVTGGTLNCIKGTIKYLTPTSGTFKHTGGTATCIKQAECTVCGRPYGSTNPNNHAGKVLYIPAMEATCKDGGNNVYYQCWDCKNFFKDDGCTKPTTANAERTSKDPKNHTGTLGDYQHDKDNHWKVYSCCSAVAEKAAHDFSSGNTCVCGYEKPRRTYRGSGAPTISAVLSHADAASATDYTSGIYGLTFRSTASFASFRGVQVDGKTIASSNYIAEEGSIVVYLKAAYLQTLAKGSHTVTILSTEGNVTANFTIGGVQSAKTGDPGVMIYAVMALTSYTGTALVLRGRKRK